MALYMTTQKIDRETGESPTVVINAEDAKREGINKGDIVSLTWKQDVVLYVVAEITDTEIPQGVLGVYEDVWMRYKMPSGETAAITVIDRPESIDYIKEKLLGNRLTEHQLAVIAQDISDQKIREVEIAYFMATFFNPGFNDEEVLGMVKGMAKAGDILDFKRIKGNDTLVVDKHSIGGVAGKGVTTVLVPIIASFDLVIPNTSTRAITSPAGTTDILETVMPVGLTNQEVMDTVAETGACMIWGGALKLSPADDVLINVERGLHVQSFQKLLVSIVAKKVSMGISHILIDIPYGPGTKVENPDDVETLKQGFIDLFAKVNINCQVHTRHVLAPDSFGVGPVLEMRDCLRVLERHEDRPQKLESTVLDMAAKILEMSGKAEEGKGRQLAQEALDSQRALAKFWEIAKTQGAKKEVRSHEMKPGQYNKIIKADKAGTITWVNNKEVVDVARTLGTPFINDAGLYFHKKLGDKVEKGDELVTLFATSSDRLTNGVEAYDMEKMFTISNN